jgi:MFS family permease
LAHPAVLLLAVVDFFINAGLYGIGFWLPQILKDTGVTDLLHIGLLSAIPYGVAVVVMILVGRHSDQTGERRWHLALSFFVGAVGLVGCGLFGHQTVLSMFALTIAATGILTCFPIFWTLPSEFLTGVGVATAIGLINSSGNLAGFVSPWLLGTIKDATHSVALGLYTLAAGMTLGGVIVLARKVRRHPLAGEVRQISGVISKTP